ncbi:MAG: exosortase/archaeosortase family protein [Phycisphaerales bacterium]|nr:exosortase/archaeosortase family protein [Phycisphaerales bacterium]
MNTRTHTTAARAPDLWLRVSLLIGLLLLLGISQFRVLGELAYVWLNDPDAGHGLLVPWLALYLVWQARGKLRAGVGSPSSLGLAVLVVALAARAAGIWWWFPYFDRLSIVLALWGLILTMFGMRTALATLMPIAFLLTAIPLPGRFQTTLAGPLQEFATRATEYLLVATGVPLTRAGNVIVVQDYQIAVAEACNGLRMLLAYAMICIFFAMVIRRAWWERVLMLLVILPVALAANVIRIYATALIVIFVDEDAAGVFFHDIAGYIMMPLSVFMLLVWLWLIRRAYCVDKLGTEIAQLGSVSTVALEKHR